MTSCETAGHGLKVVGTFTPCQTKVSRLASAIFNHPRKGIRGRETHPLFYHGTRIALKMCDHGEGHEEEGNS